MSTLSPEQMAAWYPLVVSNRRLMAVLDTELRQACDITIADYGILTDLGFAPRFQRRMYDLATSLALEPSVLTYRVKRLEERGWVKRIADPEDGRGVLATMTEPGRRLLRKASVVHLRGVRRHFLDQIHPDQLVVLADVFWSAHERLVGPKTQVPAVIATGLADGVSRTARR